MTPKRKCSVCRRPGHAKNNCPKLTAGERKKTIGKMVRVNVAKMHVKSPHMVDLSGKKEKPEWHGIGVFQEAPRVKESREVINWAEMVRAENAKCKFQNAELPETKMEKVEKLRVTKPQTSIVKLLKFNLQSEICNLKSVILHLKPSINYRRLAYASVAMFLLVAIPFPAVGYYQKLKQDSSDVVAKSSNAFLSLQSSTVAALQANFLQAQTDLNLALESFGGARDILEKEHKALVYVMSVLPILGEQVQSRQHLLLAGHHLALGNTYLIKGIKETSEESTMSMTDKLALLATHLRSAIPQYEEAMQDLSQVDESVIPVEYQQSFYDFKTLFSAFVGDMRDIHKLAQSFDALLGSEQPKRYLLVFQNPHELRPTGGFMGSFAVLDVQKGKIVNFEIPDGGTYDLQGQLDVFVKPPAPLQLINTRWEFQDSNWFPDFPTAAKKIAWFYQHGRNSTVDGVIAINASVLERILTVLGPVSSEKFGMELSSGDALAKIQKQVEVDYDKEENKPKAIIGDLAGQLLVRAQDLNAMSAVRLAAELHEALAQKEIQVYVDSSDNGLPELQEFGWTGEIAATKDNQDYLLVVNANVIGNKTDAYTDQIVEHQAIIQDDGSVIDTVVIKRHNSMKDGGESYGVNNNNVDFIRVYVPDGSEFIEGGGFNYPPEQSFKVPEDWYKMDADLGLYETGETVDGATGTRITHEFGKIAFGNWIITPPGETSAVYFTYRLPFKVFALQKHVVPSREQLALAKIQSLIMAGAQPKEYSSYSLLAQKQSGINSQFNTRIIYPSMWQPVWETNQDLSLALNGAEYHGELKTDMALGVIMEKPIESK